jgi:isopenicillin N synthase-like dioxygenase
MTVNRPDEYKDVRTANLSTIQFRDLFDKDEGELKKLITSCEKDGFFYLDLQGEGSEKFWKDLHDIDKITKEWFAQPADVKLKTPTVSLSHG